MGAAWSYLCISLLLLPVNYYLVMRALEMNLAELASIFWRPVLATMAMYFSATEIAAYFVGQESITLLSAGLISSVLVGALVYVALILLLWQSTGRAEGAEIMVLRRVPLAQRWV